MRVDLEKIVSLRKAAGLTQADMAAALGYKSDVGYLHLEKGHSRMRAEHLAVIEDVLRVPRGGLLLSAASQSEAPAL